MADFKGVVSKQMLRNGLKTLVQPKILIPVVLSIALLGFLFAVSDVRTIGDRIASMRLSIVALIFPLVLVYLALKVIQFRYFLRDIHIRVPWKTLLLAFATGEMSTSVPGGMFLQNYVLRRIADAGFARSSAATVAILATEASVALTALAILGVPGWKPVRPAVLLLFAIGVVVILVLTRVKSVRDLLGRIAQIGPLRLLERGLVDLVAALGSLFKPRVAIRALLVAGGYLLAISAGLFLVAHSIGEVRFTYLQAVTTYLFALAVVLVSPVSSQVGLIEASGVGVLGAMGYSPTDALAMLVGLRLVWTLSEWIVCGLLLFILRSEWRRPLRPQSPSESS